MGNLFIPNKNSKNIAQPDYGTDMRQIEEWANGEGTITEITTATPSSLDITNPFGPVVNIDYVGSPGAGYASLTGPGGTNPTGALTQGGDLTVDGTLTADGGVTSTDGIVNNTSGVVSLESYSGDFLLKASSGNNGLIEVAGNGDLTISTTGNGQLFIGYDSGSGSDTNVLIETDDGNLELKTVGSGGITIAAEGTGNIDIATVSSGKITIYPTGNLSFFGVTGHTQQSGTGVTTVAQLVTILQNYGLLS